VSFDPLFEELAAMHFNHPNTGPSLQQRMECADTRQQQQDNGTHEFQPVRQQGDGRIDDTPHTLEAYLLRARLRGDMPVPPAPGDNRLRPRPELRLAKSNGLPR
jgi:hypothetical protein